MSRSQGVQKKPNGPRSAPAPEKKVVLYARQSSGSTWTHGRKRQFDAGAAAIKSYMAENNVKKFKTRRVGEIKNGSLPLDKRDTLMSLLLDPDVDVIGVENLRAISRSTLRGEQFYEIMTANNKKIIPYDMPDCFDPNPHPSQAYSRRSVLNAQEFEKDSIVYRTSNALNAKLQQEKKKGKRMREGQSGGAKVNGRMSLLEAISPPASTKKKLATACRQRAKGKFGWRTLAAKMSKLLMLEEEMTHETARRTSQVLVRLRHCAGHVSKSRCLDAIACRTA